MKKQGFFCQIFVIGGILIEGDQATWATLLATSMILKYDRALNFFPKKKETFKAKLK